jgi:hypothetical protein
MIKKMIRGFIVARRFKKRLRTDLDNNMRTAHLNAVASLDPLSGKKLDRPWSWDEVQEPTLASKTHDALVIPYGKKS